ncbi:MAG: YbaK/EbsC family protein [Candidatus Korarchaeum sp.]
MPRSIEELVRKLGGEVIETEREVSTVKQAAEEMGVPEDQIIKTLVVITPEGPLLAVLSGNSRLDLVKLGGRLATREEVRELTGFEVGEVPPSGEPLRTLIDERVLERDVVYGGGGSRRRLIKISPKAILEHQRAEVTDLRE